ncbi:receptor-type tyrosine-protein phosphatase mu-like isoform X2 [Haliotis asinina]|uniref:receptor-type tyrosine-protein phosphatase mu-like isoform X2 n=1 Tax=Haliotis asinina TaxID=109174 RepID=UPI0035327947
MSYQADAVSMGSQVILHSTLSMVIILWCLLVQNDEAAYFGTTCVVLVAVVVLVVTVYRRRLRGRQQNQTGTPGTPHSTYTCSVKRPGGDLCDELSGDTWKEYMQGEFQKLHPPHIQPVNCASLNGNKDKNRYKDILPFDATRVILETEQEDDSDYINASYLDDYMATAAYVAAQGPLNQTKNDFWRMIWQLNTNKIVMLTNLMEMGRVKCHRYWPDCTSESTMYGCISVQFVEEDVYNSHTIRSLSICKEGTKSRLIQQFHFTQWPDHGVPEDTATLLHFYRVVKESGPPLSGPLVVHCSAGVGRTGTFLSLDYLLDQARNEGRVCVFNCVQHFRMKRMKMVQTKEQYIFIHSILKDALQSEHTFKEPVHIQCETCWYGTEKHSDEEEVLYENVPRHVTRQLQRRDGNAASLPDVCDLVCDTVPLLTIHTDSTADERVPEVTMDEEAGKVIWVSPL